MTKEEKIKIKKERKHKRCEKRRLKIKINNKEVINYMCEYNVEKWEARQILKYGTFIRDGKTMQPCSWLGVCEFPCNGDC